MLRSLSFRPTGVVEILSEGIKVTVEEGRSIQANAYLKAATFSSYQFNPPPFEFPTPLDDDDQFDPVIDSPRCRFGISLTTLLECLNIFGNAGGGLGSGAPDDIVKADGGGSTSLEMRYAGEGEPLIILLEEGGTVTRCEMTTYEPDELMDLAFEDEFRVQKLIMKSNWLRDAFSEIDQTSERLSILFAPPNHVPTPYNRVPGRGDSDDENEFDQTRDQPIFRLEATGTLGSTEMDYPDDREVLETYDCEHPIRNTYKFSHIQLTQRALAASLKTVRKHNVLEFMIPLSTPSRFGGVKKTTADLSGFVEFLCVPLEEEVG